MAAKQSAARRVAVLVGTRKGAFVFRSDAARRSWRVEGPHFLGHIVHHVVADPRNPKLMLCAARAGHLGPTVFRSSDAGKHWKECAQPPAFDKAAEGSARAESVAHTFWLTPGHASEPGVWYAGTSPPALFRSSDDGNTWQGVDGFNKHPDRLKWIPEPDSSPPDGATMHSINVDAQDANHLLIGASSGGVFESHDRGATWKPLNKGVEAEFLPEPDADYGHDPHCVRMHPQDPSRIAQQNHCGIYLLDRAAQRWQRIGRNMPKRVGDIGFPLVMHPREPDRFWVFPMDGSSVWPRTSPGGRPAVYGTADAGRSWQRLDKGLPEEQAWWTVRRQAMSVDACARVGLYFGTTSGELWASTNEGAQWRCIARHLPLIHSVEALAW